MNKNNLSSIRFYFFSKFYNCYIPKSFWKKKNIYYEVKENTLHENTNVKISKIIMWIPVHLLCMSCWVELIIRIFSSSFTSTNLKYNVQYNEF